MNWLDRTIGWFDPQAGARRLAHRRVLEVHGRAYAAAKRDPRNSSWVTPGTSANAEVGAAEELVRNRARASVRDNGYALKALNVFTDHVVGTGIVGAPTGLGERTAKRVTQALTDWMDACDFDGDQCGFGLQSSAVRGMGESGASLIRFRRVAFDANTTIAPVRLQVMEPDFIDVLKNGTTNDGGEIDRGIEYDAQGRKAAYWLFPRHPGDVAAFRARVWQSERVPASEVVYLYDKLRPGQDRGISMFAPAVMPLTDLRGYFDAEAVRKRIESCLAGFITSPENDVQLGVQTAGEPQKTAMGRLIEKFEPGMLTRLRPGEDITISQPGNSQGVAEYAQLVLREVAAGAGVMYEQLTGDFSNVNYSSWRAGSHGFQRHIERIQWLVVIHKLCRVMGDRFREAAIAAQLVPTSNFRLRWTPPGFISVDPYKDAQADLANLRMGKVTLSQLIAARGYDYLEFLGQYAEDLTAADAALGSGVMFDGDPRKQLKGLANAEAGNERPAIGGAA